MANSIANTLYALARGYALARDARTCLQVEQRSAARRHNEDPMQDYGNDDAHL
jgi:hypothetical protein